MLVACAAALVVSAGAGGPAAAGLLPGRPPLTARGAPVIDPGKVVYLTVPGVELTAPVDGRLRGDGVALVVNGAALADQAGGRYDTVSAGPGRHLIVFAFSQVRQPDQPPPPPSSLALVTDGERRSVDVRFLPDNGPFSFAASIPAKTADIDLELSAAGFSQRRQPRPPRRP